MKRIEIIANQSVRDELIEGLEASMPDIEYTMIPIVHGKGKRKRKEGTRTWPETNFYLILYTGEAGLAKTEATIADIRKRFPDEGLFASASESRAI
jgi:nitrogen regulatory protein PII